MSDWSTLREKAQAAKEQMDNGPQEWPGRPSRQRLELFLPQPVAPQPQPQRQVDVVVDLRETTIRHCARCRSAYGLTPGQPLCINCNRDLWRKSHADNEEMDA